MGGLLASAAAPSPERRALFSLNTLTGGTSLDPSAINAPLATRPTQLFVYRPRSAKGPAVRIRLGEEQTTQELAAGQFLSFSPNSDQPLRVYVYFLPGAGPETSLTITPTAEAPTYLECVPKLEKPLHQVPDKEGAAVLNKLADD
jgi:hypothetical protein